MASEIERELINEIEDGEDDEPRLAPTPPTSSRYTCLNKLNHRTLWESTRELVFENLDCSYDMLTDDDKNKLNHVTGYFEDLIEPDRFLIKHVKVENERLTLELVNRWYVIEVWVDYETTHCLLMRYEDRGDFHCIVNIGVNEDMFEEC